MMLRALALLTATTVLASAVPSAAVQIEPEAPIGSLVKRKPVIVDPVRAGASVKAFARCTYGRKPDAVRKLMTFSDPVVIDHDRAETSGWFTGTKLLVEDCLGRELNIDTMNMELRLSPARLRVLMMEEDYLARNAAVPAIDSGAAAPDRTFFATGDDSVKAQAIARFSDCVVTRNSAAADALVRTMPGQDEERTAARALAPALGACLLQGEEIKLTPALVRVYAVEGLWARSNKTEEVK